MCVYVYGCVISTCIYEIRSHIHTHILYMCVTCYVYMLYMYIYVILYIDVIYVYEGVCVCPHVYMKGRDRYWCNL